MIIPNILKNRNYLIILFSILYISLLVGFFFNENATGGAIGDYSVKRTLIINFSENFIGTLLNFDQFEDRHTPVMTMYFSIFESLSYGELKKEMAKMYAVILNFIIVRRNIK